MGHSITTALTRLLGVQTPVVCAPMAGGAGGALAAEVTRGGGFGFMQAGYGTVENFKNEIAIARSRLGAHSRTAPLPIGAGFIAWVLEKPGSTTIEILDTALENRVKAVWFAFGNDLGRWVSYVRAYDAKVADGHKTIVFVQVNSVKDALSAEKDWKVDVIVAQGIEAGGHGSASAPPLLTLVPSVLRALQPDGPPVLAAGGLVDGAHLAALLVLGASGMVLGTRFLLTPESLYLDAQKRALLDADAAATTRTMAFDRVRGTLGWPAGIDGRALRNRIVEEIDAGVLVEQVQVRFKQAVGKGDKDGMLVWSGTGVGLMSSVKTSVDVVHEIHAEAIKHLNTSNLLGADPSL